MKKPIFQKGFFWLFVFSLSLHFNSANAAFWIKDPVPSNATLPYFCRNFCVEAGFLYFQPYIPMVDYVDIVPLANRNSTFVNVDTDYFLGTHARLGFFIPHTSNDVVIEFRGFNNGSTDVTDKPVDADLFRNLANPGTLFNTQTNINVAFDGDLQQTQFFPFVQRAKGSSKYNVTAIDLDGGQYINLTPCISLRAFGGIRYTNYKASLNARYTFEQTIVTPRFEPPVDGFAIRVEATLRVVDVVNQSSEFDAIGPRLGGEIRYDFTPHIALVAMGASSILVGRFQDTFEDTISRVGTAIVTRLEGVVPPFTVTTVVPGVHQDVFNDFETETTRCVPNIDAKAGLQFRVPLRHKLFKQAMLELGYYSSNYFNVANRRTGIEVTEPEFLTVRYIESGFQGFYLDLGLCG